MFVSSYFVMYFPCILTTIYSYSISDKLNCVVDVIVDSCKMYHDSSTVRRKIFEISYFVVLFQNVPNFCFCLSVAVIRIVCFKEAAQQSFHFTTGSCIHRMCFVFRFDGNVCTVLPYPASGQHYHSYPRCLRILGAAFLQLDSSYYVPLDKGTEGILEIFSSMIG